MATVTMNADKDFDSVKTHPDCLLRYKQVLPSNSIVPETDCCKAINGLQPAYKERAMIEMVRDAYERRQFTFCAHLCLFAMKNGYSNAFYPYFLSLSFSGISDADQHFRKFSVTDAGAVAGSSLKELQDFIFDLNGTNIATVAGYFLDHTPASNPEDFQFAQLKFNEQVKGKDLSVLQQKFKSSFPDSKYNYFLNPKTN
ncbi:MAG: hypothetical protein JWQ27_826 [Ferruginibacter sp.]|nr:hypothetical protein [Ferruginibacter sp.]